MGCFSKLSEMLNAQKIYDNYIYPLINKKFHFSDYIDFKSILSFMDDGVVVVQHLIAKNYKSALKLLRGHIPLLAPLLGIALEVLIKKLPLGELTQLVLLKVNFCIQAITCGFWLGLAMYFGFQCYDLYKMESALSAAKKEISCEATKKEFELLEKYVKQLKGIEANIERIKLAYGETKDFVKRSAEIQAEMKKANDIAEEAYKIVVSLDKKFATQKIILKNTKDQAKVACSISGVLLGLSVAAVFFFPLFGAVAIAANVITTSWSGTVLYRVNGTLKEIVTKQNEINVIKTELDEIIARITKEAEEAQKLETKDESHAFLDDILN